MQLNYLDEGRGTPVVFVHEGLGDYREWNPQLAAFAAHYRVISYSRRYNYPNTNPLQGTTYSAQVDADDLAALIRALHLGPVHLVGHSYGALAAMMLVVRQPELVHSLTLAEPPVLSWLPDLLGGKQALNEFRRNLLIPNFNAFRDNQPERALALTVDYFGKPGDYAALPGEVRIELQQNIVEWRALMTSSATFPPVDRNAVSSLAMPVLLIMAGKSPRVHQLVNAELMRLLPHADHLLLPQASHEMWEEEPVICRDAVLHFLEHQIATAPPVPRE